MSAWLPDLPQSLPLAAVHLLRPHWLWLLLALPVLAWWWGQRRRHANAWREAVDPHLLPHLLQREAGMRGRGPLWLGLLAYALAVLALAGPSWRQVEQPLWQTRAPLVVALDLSTATAATDLPPSRLLQARAKLDTLLHQRAGGQAGLVVYAGAVFTVAPLTDDMANVALFLDALEPSIMPVDGQRADRAIAWSTQLLRQAGFDRGEILLLTDHADAAAQAAAAEAARAGYRVSVLGLGTPGGAAYRDATGGVAHAWLDAGSLRALATAGGGIFATLTPDAGDLEALGVLDPQAMSGTLAGGEGGRHWQDQGYWLLLPLLLLGLLAFRRGGVVAALLVCAWLPLRPAQAIELQDLWRRPDQQAHARLLEGAQAYRAGRFDDAAQRWRGLDSADGHYNRGNALARAGHYREAIAAYEAALRQQPGMADALANKAAIEALLKQQPPQGGQDQQPQDQQQGQGARQPQDGRSKAGAPQGGQGADAPRQDRPAQAPDSPGQPSPGQPRDPDEPPRAGDVQAQQQADAAQRERMRRALQQGEAGDEGASAAQPVPDETAEQRERRLANQAWLQRVPDDPGGLLRRKFALEYQRRQRQGED